MGRAKRQGDKGGEKTQKRKRRKKARTDVSSDSDSSSEDEVQVQKEESDILMEDASELPSALTVVEDDDDEADSEHEAADQKAPGKFTEKGGRIPSPLRDLHDPQADAKFEEYYMRLITEEFGDSLDSVREARDFGDNSLPMLIRALRQGVNIFDASEKRAVVKEMA